MVPWGKLWFWSITPFKEALQEQTKKQKNLHLIAVHIRNKGEHVTNHMLLSLTLCLLLMSTFKPGCGETRKNNNKKMYWVKCTLQRGKAISQQWWIRWCWALSSVLLLKRGIRGQGIGWAEAAQCGRRGRLGIFGFKSQSSHLLAVWLWTSYFTSLHSSFHIVSLKIDDT